MIEYNIEYKCDFEGCRIMYKESSTRWYFRTEKRMPTIPPDWVAVVSNESSTRLYCPAHTVHVEDADGII